MVRMRSARSTAMSGMAGCCHVEPLRPGSDRKWAVWLRTRGSSAGHVVTTPCRRPFPMARGGAMSAALIAIQSWIASRQRPDDRGASLVEYALLLVLIFVVCLVAVRVLGTTVSTSYSSTSNGFAAN